MRHLLLRLASRDMRSALDRCDGMRRQRDLALADLADALDQRDRYRTCWFSARRRAVQYRDYWDVVAAYVDEGEATPDWERRRGWSDLQAEVAGLRRGMRLLAQADLPMRELYGTGEASC